MPDTELAEELLQLEEADAWFEYLESTRGQTETRYAEVEPWAWARLSQRLRAVRARASRPSPGCGLTRDGFYRGRPGRAGLRTLSAGHDDQCLQHPQREAGRRWLSGPARDRNEENSTLALRWFRFGKKQEEEAAQKAAAAEVAAPPEAPTRRRAGRSPQAQRIAGGQEEAPPRKSRRTR